MNFELVPPRSGGIFAALKAGMPEFTTSPEYCLWKGEMDDLPGVVSAMFANYLARLASDGAQNPDVARGLSVLSELASWNDSVVDAVLEDEVFETLQGSHAVPILLPMMSGRLRELFEVWKAKGTP